MAKDRLDRLYDALVGDEDARACRDIPDDACRVVPGNFLRQWLALSLTKLGDALASPKTTLAWLLAAVAAPAWMLGWLVPLREAGSLLPQLAIAAWVRRMSRRKWAWIAGAVLQALAVAAMAVAAATLEGAVAGGTVLAALAVFSLSRGLCSVASKDVLGKTVPKGRRGRLVGFAASAAGAVSLLVAAALWAGFDSREPRVLAWLLAAGAATWALAALVYAGVREQAGETEGGASGLREALSRLRLLREDPPFRRFVLARALMLVSALSAPYLVLLSREHGAGGGLAPFLFAAGLASLVSGPAWGRFADASSRGTLVAAGLGATAVVLAALAASAWWPPDAGGAWVFGGLFFLLGIAHAGVRLGRKTYLVDLAKGNRRTDYVAVSNTCMGVLLLLAGAATGAASLVSTQAALGLLAAMGLAGAAVARGLPRS